MSSPTRLCPHSEVDHIRKYLAHAKQTVNDNWYYPPANAYRYLVALALYSKSLTVAEATLVLLDAGFNDEAFGMTRTLLDLFFTMHYIGNKDTEERAKLFYQFHSKDIHDLSDVILKYWPQLLQGVNPKTGKAFPNYPHPHRWSGKPLSQMALEPDTVEVDAKGKPVVHDLWYRLIFRLSSHYVHPTIVALRNHIVRPGRDNFVVHSGRGQNYHHLTAFFVATHVVLTMISFYRCMGDPQPDSVDKWAKALVEHLGRRHE